MSSLPNTRRLAVRLAWFPFAAVALWRAGTWLIDTDPPWRREAGIALIMHATAALAFFALGGGRGRRAPEVKLFLALLVVLHDLKTAALDDLAARSRITRNLALTSRILRIDLPDHLGKRDGRQPEWSATFWPVAVVVDDWANWVRAPLPDTYQYLTGPLHSFLRDMATGNWGLLPRRYAAPTAWFDQRERGRFRSFVVAPFKAMLLPLVLLAALFLADRQFPDLGIHTLLGAVVFWVSGTALSLGSQDRNDRIAALVASLGNARPPDPGLSQR